MPLVVKNPPANAGDIEMRVRHEGSVSGLGRSPGRGMATHSSILAWRIPWKEEPGELQSMGLYIEGRANLGADSPYLPYTAPGFHLTCF